MRAKYINEKFTEDSDPIKDMDIGIYRKINFKTENEIVNYIWDIFPHLLGGKIPDNFIYNIETKGFFGNDKVYQLWISRVCNYIETYITLKGKPYIITWEFNNAFHNALMRYGYKIHPKFKTEFKNAIYRDNPDCKINESLNEKFIENSDSIHDMGIGQKEAINYSINKFYELDKENKNILDHSFYTFYTSNEYVVSFIHKRDNKTKYSYFKNLAEESGLESYINIDDNNQDSFPTNEVSWSIPKKYQEYFNKIDEEINKA